MKWFAKINCLSIAILLFTTVAEAGSVFPVRILQNPSAQFNSIQEAYNQAEEGNTIQCRDVTVYENLTLNRPVNVTIEGGYNADFSANAGGVTAIIGTLYVSNGKIYTKNIIITGEDSSKKPAVPVLNYVDPMYSGAYPGWTPVSGAKGYKVKYGTVSGSYTNIAYVGNVTTYTVENLTNHIEYYFTVSAYNNYGESANSNELMVIPHLRDPNNENQPPTVVNFIPADKDRFYAGDVVAVSVALEDEVYHYDAAECRFLFDGVVVQDWSTNFSCLYESGSGDFGAHTITIQARDEYDAHSESIHEIFIYRKPVAVE